MQEKVELVKMRSVGEIIDDSILLFKQNYRVLLKSYFSICGFFWLAGTASTIINQLQMVTRIEEGESRFGLFYFLGITFDVLSFTMLTLTTLSFIALYKEKGNESPTLPEIWGYVKYYFFRAFGSSLVLFTAMAVGLVCCIVPGIYLLIVFVLILPIMVLENGTLGYSFNRSFQLIKYNWWPTFAAILVIYIIIAAAMGIVALPEVYIIFIKNLLSGTGSKQTYLLISVIIPHSLQFVYMLPVIAAALIYYSLTEQKDDSSLLARIEMLGKYSPTADQLPTEDY